ncbi:hypothetical protein [Bartonella sp. HY038]|uniref:hypothetical protein n=1 Tax=Bartonella sp. HY038 TaxID=2759660 RepID=UPI0015F97184|nr:hypothetical protein [Bartonella sp. HY038]
MRHIIGFISILVLLAGCGIFRSSFPPEIQDKWRGQPIENLQKITGFGSFKTDRNGEKFYYLRPVVYERGGMAYCEFRAYVDEHNRITRLYNYKHGLDCMWGYLDDLK